MTIEQEYEEAITQAVKEWHRDDPRSQKLLHDLIRIATFSFIEKARQAGRDEAVDYIEKRSSFNDDPKDTMIIYDAARAGKPRRVL